MTGFVSILLGWFTIGVMQLILATALPFIVAKIGGGSLYSWIFSSYMLASIATIPLFSRLADIYGKRKFYMVGMKHFRRTCSCHVLPNCSKDNPKPWGGYHYSTSSCYFFIFSNFNF